MPITRSWQADLDQQAYAARLAAKSQPHAVPAPIDLDALVSAVLDGAVGDQPMSDLATIDGACEAVIRVAEAKSRTTLLAGDRTKVEIATALEFNRRKQAARAALKETQLALHNPMFGIGR